MVRIIFASGKADMNSLRENKACMNIIDLILFKKVKIPVEVYDG